MDTATADDNFFIEEPQKLTNNFFNKDKSLQMVELLAQKHHDTTNKRINQYQQMIQPCRLTYYKKLQQLQSIHKQKQLQHPLQTTIHTAANTMPRSYIAQLEILCQATYTTDDIGAAKRAIDTLVSAYKSGCCFLEKYIVMLLNFCTKKQADCLANKMNDTDDNDDTMKIKVNELLDRVLGVDFDRQQLIENLRKPESKLTSVEHIIQLLQRVQDMLDYREQVAINWLHVILDAYFVELATSDEAVDIIDRISAHINFQCALLRQVESTKCLLKSVIGQIDNDSKCPPTPTNVHQHRLKRPYYSIDQIEL